MLTQDSGGTTLSSLIEQGQQRLDTFPELAQDIFQSLYSVNPTRTDPDSLSSNAKKFNAPIIDRITADEKYKHLKTLCAGRDLVSFEAVSAFAEQIDKYLDELLAAAGGEKDSLRVRRKLEERQVNDVARLHEILTSIVEGGGDIPVSAQDEKTALRLAAQILSRERQLARLSEMIDINLRKASGIMDAAIDAATTAMLERAEEAVSAITSWGSEAGTEEAFQMNKDLFNRVRQSPRLKDISKFLGRFRKIFENARKNGYAFGRGDKYDITLGNDFSCAVSSEYACLALPETVPLFIQKVQRKTLKQYRKRERITKGYGDFIVCLDESGSMFGEPIAWGKAIAPVLVEAAARNKKNKNLLSMIFYTWKCNLTGAYFCIWSMAIPMSCCPIR